MAETNSRFLYFIGGSKGGVGKSILSMILADFLTQCRHRKIILVESDTSNPDVGKTFTHNDDVEVISLSLDNADGWIELVNYSEASDKDIVINSAARSGEAVEKFGGTLIGSLEELHRQLVSFWVINRQRDSIELLKKYMDVVPGELHVVRNTFYGEPQKFELFNNSKTKVEALRIVLPMICILSVFPLLKLWKICRLVIVLNLNVGALSLGKCLMILPLALTKKNLPRKIRTDSLNHGYYTGN